MKVLSCLFLLFGIIFLIPAETVSAQGAFSYTPLESLPGSSDASRFPDYVQGIYKFGMWTVGLAALFMITVGGFIYLSSAGNTSTMGTAKNYIWDAIIGLVLAILAWLILNIINPDLVNVNLDRFSQVGGVVPTATSTPSQSSGNPITSPIPATLPTGAAAIMATQMIDAASAPGRNITWENSPDCASTAGNVTPRMNFQETANGLQMTACHSGCNKTTSLCNGKATMSSHLLTALYGFAASGNKFKIVSVSGGSHSNTSKHYNGTAIDIDIADRTKFKDVRDAFNAINNKGADPVIAYCDNGSYCPCEVATHLHIQSIR